MFYVDTNCDEKFAVYLDTEIIEQLPNFHFHGSLITVAARTLGYSYVEYLKYCVINGAALHGREGYTYPLYDKRKDAEKVCQELNRNWIEVENYLRKVIKNNVI